MGEDNVILLDFMQAAPIQREFHIFACCRTEVGERISDKFNLVVEIDADRIWNIQFALAGQEFHSANGVGFLASCSCHAFASWQIIPADFDG